MLELLERLALEERAEARAVGDAPTRESFHVGNADPGARGQDQQSLERVAKLANVAWPIHAREDLDGGRVEYARRHPFALRECAHEMRCEQRDVFAPLAERRDVEWHDIEPV